MDKKDILLGKFIGCQNGFCLTTKSTNENDIYYVQDIVGSKSIIENYEKLSSDAFEAYLNNLSVTSYKIGNRISELQNVTNNAEFDRVLDRILSNSRNTRIKFKDIIDRIYIKFNIAEQINILEKQIKNLKKYQDIISEPNVFYTSQKLQAISLLKSLDVKGRTDSQKLVLIKDSLSKMEYTLPSFDNAEEFEEELIEPTPRAGIIISSEEIVEEQPRSVFSTEGIVEAAARLSNNATYGFGTSEPLTLRIEPNPYVAGEGFTTSAYIATSGTPYTTASNRPVTYSSVTEEELQGIMARLDADSARENSENSDLDIEI